METRFVEGVGNELLWAFGFLLVIIVVLLIYTILVSGTGQIHTVHPRQVCKIYLNNSTLITSPASIDGVINDRYTVATISRLVSGHSCIQTIDLFMIFQCSLLLQYNSL